MAVDTRQKRFSMLNAIAASLPTKPLFQADGDVDPGDRLHLLNLYSGIPAGVTAIVGGKFAAGQVYHQGFQKGQVYTPGFHRGQVYTPGFVAGSIAHCK